MRGHEFGAHVDNKEPDVWYRSSAPFNDLHTGSCDVWYPDEQGERPCTCDPVEAERIFLEQAGRRRR